LVVVASYGRERRLRDRIRGLTGILAAIPARVVPVGRVPGVFPTRRIEPHAT
jgi:hypothetical protein